jgi:hypothetical protein
MKDRPGSTGSGSSGAPRLTGTTPWNPWPQEPKVDSSQAAPVLTEKEKSASQRKTAIGVGIAVVFLIAILVVSVIWLIQPGTPTDKIRDIFIIFMAVQSLVIGMTLVILIVQISRLINLLNNEVRPILDSTNESVNTLRGTLAFLSENITEPIIKLNESIAAVKQAGEFLRFLRRK